mgnify:CR=1 FL=1|jgi:hypothetical protein
MNTAQRIVCVLGMVAALAGCTGEPQPTNPQPGIATDATGNRSVTGTIKGTRVDLRMAEFDGQLALFEDEGWAWSPSLLVFLFIDEDGVPEGRTFTVTPNAEPGSGIPHVHYRWRNAGTGEIDVDSVMDGYAMTLSFGEVSAGLVPGSIEFSIPGSQTSVSGSFLASVE